MLKKWLEGKKTYMVSMAMVVSGMLAGFGRDEADAINLMDCNWEQMNWVMILEGLGLSTLRASLANFMPILRRKSR